MAIVEGAAAGLHAIARGATILQLRAPALNARQLLEQASQLVSSASVPVLLSSRLDVAKLSGAAGVNLPERDIEAGEARRYLGTVALVGRSVHSVAAAQAAQEQGAGFVIFGPVYASASHPGRTPEGLEALQAVAGAVSIPVLAVGGVDAARAGECLGAGAAGFAAITMFR